MLSELVRRARIDCAFSRRQIAGGPLKSIKDYFGERPLLWHRIFQAAVLIKALDGLLEITGGIALLMSTPAIVRHFVTILTHNELIEDPHDFVANWVLRLAHGLSIDAQHFAAAYLLAHGVIKVGLAIGLLRGVHWVYPAALIFLVIFILYQVGRIAYSHSIILSLVTGFDLVVVALIFREWKRARMKAGHR